MAVYGLNRLKNQHGGDGRKELPDAEIGRGESVPVPVLSPVGINVPGIRERFRPEENPCDAREEEGAKNKQTLAQRVVFRETECAKKPRHDGLSDPADDEIDPVKQAPEHISPVRPVPESADPEGHENVPGAAQGRDAAATERHVNVVAEPGGERHVPATPELPDRAGVVWRVEIFHQFEPEHAGGADRDVGVAGKVAIDLIREKDGRDGQLQAVVALRRRVDVVHVDCQSVGHHELLEEAPSHPLQSADHPTIFERMELTKLPEQILRTFDWPGHELGKKHHIGRVRREIPLGFLMSPVDLDDVAETLKRMKRETDRKNDIERGIRDLPPEQAGEAHERAGEEGKVLEDKKDEARGDDADDQ